MFISPAYAQAAGGLGGNDILQFVPFIAMLAIFYFLLFRPQQQKAKLHREMIMNIKRGDRVVTAGGLVGRVVRVKDDATVEVEIAEGTKVEIMRAYITDVRAKGEPVKEAA
jgi:preprotein translocase subunit YajC